LVYQPRKTKQLHLAVVLRKLRDDSIPKLRGDALLVGKSEAASALIYWNGKRYVWLQQGD